MSDWKYDTEEVGEDGYEPKDREQLAPLEPGSPTLENTAFVVLGVATMLFVFGRVVLLAA